ncbi:MAG: hypothetical protein IPK26_02775 [Planctomycetes bacterium]|nr:hypothetical protein [Planctomycetota bacterium]
MRALVPVAITLLTATAFAQTRLVGLTHATASLLHRHQAACVNTSCTPVGFPPMAGLPYFGGTAWDPIQSGAWISEGNLLALVGPGCGYLCPPAPAPVPGSVTGLEVVESLNEIWATDSLGNIVRLNRSCPPTFLSSCNTGIVSTPTRGLSGLAVDEGRQLVFWCVGDWALGSTRLFVAQMGTPCAPFHAEVPTACSPPGLRVLTGLAVDWGNSILYMTDGMTTMGWSYVYNPAGPSIAFTPVSCCTVPAADLMIGLAVQTEPAVPAGNPCASGTCPACPMLHTTVGDPNLGNAAFGLALDGAPAGSVAVCVLDLGTCVSPGVTLPGFCGALWMTLPLFGNSPPLFPTGPGCAASTVWSLPLPPVTWLAGLPLASQFVAFCPGGGISLSNCLSFVLQGN